MSTSTPASVLHTFSASAAGYTFNAVIGSQSLDVTRNLGDFLWLDKAMQKELTGSLIPSLQVKDLDGAFPPALVCQHTVRCWFEIILLHPSVISAASFHSFLTLPKEGMEKLKHTPATAEAKAVGALDQLKAVLGSVQKAKGPPPPNPRDGPMSSVRKNHAASKLCIAQFKSLATQTTAQIQSQLKRTTGGVGCADAYRQKVGKTPVRGPLSFGDRVEDKQGRPGTVMSIGLPLDGKGPSLVGVCWDDPAIGDCAGDHQGERRFHCGPTQGSFLKSDQLFRACSDVDIASHLCRTAVELDLILFNPKQKQQCLDAACRLYSLLMALATTHQGFMLAYQRLIELHEELVIGESWLHHERSMKRDVVTKELQADDLVKKLQREWEAKLESVKSNRETIQTIIAVLERQVIIATTQMQCTLEINSWGDEDVRAFQGLIDVCSEMTLATVLENEGMD